WRPLQPVVADQFRIGSALVSVWGCCSCEDTTERKRRRTFFGRAIGNPFGGFRGLYGLCGCFLRTQQRVFDFLQAMFVLAPSHSRFTLGCGLACVGFLWLAILFGWLVRFVFQVYLPRVGWVFGPLWRV